MRDYLSCIGSAAVPRSDMQTHTFSILTPRWLRSDVLSHGAQGWDANLNCRGRRGAEQPTEEPETCQAFGAEV